MKSNVKCPICGCGIEVFYVIDKGPGLYKELYFSPCTKCRKIYKLKEIYKAQSFVIRQMRMYEIIMKKINGIYDIKNVTTRPVNP